MAPNETERSRRSVLKSLGTVGASSAAAITGAGSVTAASTGVGRSEPTAVETAIQLDDATAVSDLRSAYAADPVVTLGETVTEAVGAEPVDDALGVAVTTGDSRIDERRATVVFRPFGRNGESTMFGLQATVVADEVPSTADGRVPVFSVGYRVESTTIPTPIRPVTALEVTGHGIEEEGPREAVTEPVLATNPDGLGPARSVR